MSDKVYITSEWFNKFDCQKMIGYNFIIDHDKILTISHNDGYNWYAFFRNRNDGLDHRGNIQTDDLVILRSDLKYIDEVELLYLALTGKNIPLKIEK